MVSAVGNTMLGLPSSANVKAAATLIKRKQSVRFVLETFDDPRPRVCLALITAMHALKRSKLSLEKGELTKPQEALRVGRETESFRRTFQQLAELTDNHNGIHCMTDTENTSMGHGDGICGSYKYGVVAIYR